MIEESIKSIKADLYDRVSSPLIFGFFVAWCVWNYKFLLVLLSDEKVLEKVRIIDEVLYRTEQQIILNGILYPLLSALIYIFIYPYPAKFIFSFYKKRQAEIIAVKKEIENNTLLTLEESFSIRNKIDKLEREYEEVIKRKDQEIQAHKNKFENYTLEINSNDIGVIDDQLVDLQLKVLSIIADNIDITAMEIDNFLQGINSRQVRYVIESLENKGYVKYSNAKEAYTVTSLGEKVLVENEMGIPS
ncbi:MAG: hypothetical protein ACKVJE_22200 [Pseudomonadales bacterium]